MSHQSHITSQNIQEAASEQPLLAPAPFQTLFGVPQNNS